MGQGGGPEALPREDQMRELGTVILTRATEARVHLEALKTCHTGLCTRAHGGMGGAPELPAASPRADSRLGKQGRAVWTEPRATGRRARAASSTSLPAPAPRTGRAPHASARARLGPGSLAASPPEQKHQREGRCPEAIYLHLERTRSITNRLCIKRRHHIHHYCQTLPCEACGRDLGRRGRVRVRGALGRPSRWPWLSEAGVTPAGKGGVAGAEPGPGGAGVRF